MSNIANRSGDPKAAPPTDPVPAPKPKPAEPDRFFYTEALTKRTLLVFHLRSGRTLTGILRTFGTFTLDVETSAGRVLLYKHANGLVETFKVQATRNAQPGAKPEQERA